MQFMHYDIQVCSYIESSHVAIYNKVATYPLDKFWYQVLQMSVIAIMYNHYFIYSTKHKHTLTDIAAW